MEEKDFSKSIKLTFIILFGASLFWFLFACQLIWAYDPGGSPLDLKKNSRMNDTILIQPGTGTSGGSDTARFRTYYGTQACVGVGSNGYILSGTLTGLPFIDYLYGNGSSTINFSGFTHVAIGGSDIPSSSSVNGKIDAVAGTGTTNVFTDTTLAGQGTLTATLRANAVDISPTEIGYLDGVSSNVQTQITTATGSITNHTHTGSDGTPQIAHDSVTGTGANSHATIDNFIASKAAASGLASLDANSLVVQNPASGTSTPGANKIIMSDGTGKASDGWLSNNITKLGTPTTDNISEGSTNRYYTDARVNAAVGSLSVNALSDVIVSSPANGQFITYNGSEWINGTSSVSVGFGAVTGAPTDNAYFTTTPSTNKVPYTGTSNNLNAWIDNTIISIPGTTTQITGTSSSGRWYNLQQIGGSDLDSYTKLLLHMNNPGTTTFVNSSDYVHTVTANGNAIGTSTAKFGSGGGAFDGSGDYLTSPDSNDFNIGAGNFTVEAFVRYNTFSGSQAIVGQFAIGDEGWLVYSDGTNMQFQYSTDGSTDIIMQRAWAPSVATWYHVAVVRSGTDLKIYIDGTQLGATYNIGADTIYNSTRQLTIGASDIPGSYLNGQLDELCISKGIARWTSNFTPPTQEYGDIYNFNSATYIPPGTTTPKLIIQDSGTATTAASYMMANVDTLIVGAGTTTAVTGTTTAYAIYVPAGGGALHIDAVNLSSSKEIKENINPIKIKPDLLDAESVAKREYIASAKSAWIAANQVNYTTLVNETGTGTVTIVDNETMESDYNNYIELEWASDLNQDIYTENIQKGYEKVFWQTFDAMTPKSWNPINSPNVTERGFVVEDVPDVVKGRDGKSVSVMALIAYMTKAEQSLKADTVFALSTLKELITTGTVTQQKIDHCNDRLEVLVP